MTLKVIRQILESIKSNNLFIIDPTRLYTNLHHKEPCLYNIELMNTIEYLDSFCKKDPSIRKWEITCYQYVNSLFDYRDFIRIFNGCNFFSTYEVFEESFLRWYSYFTGIEGKMDIRDLIPSERNIKVLWKDCDPIHNYILIFDYLKDIKPHEIPSLNKVEKLKILSDATYLIQNNIYIGICSALKAALATYPKMNLRKGIGIHDFSKYINIYFPEFTRNNFAPGTTTSYWWEPEDRTSRLEALNKLIQITENENCNY